MLAWSTRALITAILEGTIQAKIQAYIFSVSWPIVSFPGFRLAEGTLLEIPLVAIHEDL